MTIEDMHISFKERLDKLDTEATPNIPIEQVDNALNEGANRFVKQRYGITNPKRQGFEETQKRTDDLSTLVTSFSSENIEEGEFKTKNISISIVNLPDDYWFMINEGVDINYFKCKVKSYDKECEEFEEKEVRDTCFVDLDDRRHNEVNVLIYDPFNRPEKYYAFRVQRDNKVFIYHDKNSVIEKYHLTYLRKFKNLKENETYQRNDPTAPDFWGNLEYFFPDHTHTEIVDLAVKYTLEIIEHPRWQSYTMQTKTHE